MFIFFIVLIIFLSWKFFSPRFVDNFGFLFNFFISRCVILFLVSIFYEALFGAIFFNICFLKNLCDFLLLTFCAIFYFIFKITQFFFRLKKLFIKKLSDFFFGVIVKKINFIFLFYFIFYLLFYFKKFEGAE